MFRIGIATFRRVLLMAGLFAAGFFNLSSVVAQESFVSHGRGRVINPPIYVQPNCPPGIVYPPGVPIPPTTPTPVDPSKKEDPKKDDPTVPPVPPVDPTTTESPLDQSLSMSPAPTSSALGTNDAASYLGMLGRADQTSRFNSFDNFNAIPRTQFWFGYQYLDNYQTTIKYADPSLTSLADITEKRPVNLYRIGAEIALSDRFSISFQHQYIASGDLDVANDAWGNPQFLLKYALIRETSTTISATAGMQPQFSTSPGELHEDATRFYLGSLFYQGFNDNRAFVQGGFQFGITDSNLPTTFDYALTGGYWLYRHESLNPGYCNACGNSGKQPFLLGIIPQVELFGKHVMDNRLTPTINTGLDFESRQSLVQAAEGEHVYDLTVGGRVLFMRGMSVGLGYSFPITGERVRDGEFLTTFNLSF